MSKTQQCHYCKHKNELEAYYCALCHRPVVKDVSGKHTSIPVIKVPVEAQESDGFRPGITRVRVLRREVNEQTGKISINECHQGIVIARTNSFVRVFNDRPVSKGGETAPEFAQLYPITSNNMWCEITDQALPQKAFPIPPLFR